MFTGKITDLKKTWKYFYNFFIQNVAPRIQSEFSLLYILTKSNAFIVHSSGRYTNPNVNKLHTLTILWMPLTISQSAHNVMVTLIVGGYIVF